MPSSISDWKRGKHVLSSTNLVRLIRAASARRATAPYEAGEAVSPEVSILHRLAALESAVAEVPTKQEFQEGLDTLRAAIDRVASRGIDEDPLPEAAEGGSR